MSADGCAGRRLGGAATAPANSIAAAKNAAATADNAVMDEGMIPRGQPSLEICSSVTTRSTFSVLLLMR